MGKYQSLRYWAKVKARVSHRCQKCGAAIGKGDVYYKEKIDFVKPPLGLTFGEPCEGCGGQQPTPTATLTASLLKTSL